VNQLADASACAILLRAMDQQILRDANAGETTCALAVVAGDRIFGASVGDSGVWMIGPTTVVDLTHRQARKPFVGSGSACPVEFMQKSLKGENLLLATDGLLKYAPAERIAIACRESDNETCAARLIELVRYPSGALPDDVTVILAAIRVSAYSACSAGRSSPRFYILHFPAANA
jgi:serine/threonine protein phosphatase PrpC